MDLLKFSAINNPPEDYQPPHDKGALIDNTDYPNLNSDEYASREFNNTLRMFPAWECITINEENHVIIATNKLSGRTWKGALFGFQNVDSSGKLTLETASFKSETTAHISRVKYISNNIFVLALRSGKLQLWSSYSEMRKSENPFCLFLIGEKHEHVTPVVCMDVMKSNTNIAVSGSKDGMLKLWDMGKGDLDSMQTYRYAHCNVITGVDSSHTDAEVFATCGLDKSALLWDTRLTRPASGLYDNHTVRFKDIAWATPTTTATENLLYIGDESGFVHTVDNRSPKKFLESFQHFDRPLRKILPNGTHVAIIGDTNCVKIVDITSDQKVIYENSQAQNFVRDGIWRTPDELLTVGFEGKLGIHNISS